jgi:hypothetical protein
LIGHDDKKGAISRIPNILDEYQHVQDRRMHAACNIAGSGRNH